MRQKQPFGRLEAFERWYSNDAPSNVNHDVVKMAFMAGWNSYAYEFNSLNYDEFNYEHEVNGKPCKIIEDGFGNCWTKCDDEYCDLQIVRPGKVTCSCSEGFNFLNINTLQSYNGSIIIAQRKNSLENDILCKDNGFWHIKNDHNRLTWDYILNNYECYSAMPERFL